VLVRALLQVAIQVVGGLAALTVRAVAQTTGVAAAPRVVGIAPVAGTPAETVAAGKVHTRAEADIQAEVRTAVGTSSGGSPVAQAFDHVLHEHHCSRSQR
jgi:hypothetical protein